MKPVAIDFLAPNREKRLWVAIVVIGLIWLIGGALRLWASSAAIADLSIQVRSVALEKPIAFQAAAVPDPRDASTQRIDSVLSRDWNKMFATVENVQLPEARLVGVSVNGESTAIRLEYRLDSLAAVSKLAQELNAGYDTPPWQFEGASASQTSPARGGPGNGIAPGFNASWSTRLSRL